MSLHDIRVREDWEDRETQARRDDRLHLRLGVVAVALSLFVFVAVRDVPLWRDSRLFLANGVAGALFLAVGAWIIAHPARRRVRDLLWRLLILVVGVLLSVIFVDLVRDTPGASPFVTASLLVGVVLALMVPGWRIILRTVRRYLQQMSQLERGVQGWSQRLLYGLLGGSVLVLLMTLTPIFSKLPHDYTPVSLAALVQQVAYVIGIRSFGEELLFRGVLFHILHRRYNWVFWKALLVVVLLNTAVYAVALPFATMPPNVVTFLVLSPLIMSTLHTILYAQEGTLISPFISNVMFQIVYFIVS